MMSSAESMRARQGGGREQREIEEATKPHLYIHVFGFAS